MTNFFKNKLAVGFLALALFAGGIVGTYATVANAQVSSPNYWKLLGGVLSPVLASWDVQVGNLTVTGTCTGCGVGGGGGGAGTFSTTTSTHAGRLINYSNNSTDIVVVGSTATTTAEYYFDPNTLTAVLAGVTINSTGLSLSSSDSFQINSVSVLNATTLGSSVTGSSLTSVGTIATGVWDGTDIAVGAGGTGTNTLTDGGVLLGSGTGAITPMAVLANGEIIVGDGTTDPVALAAFTSSTGDLIHEAGGLEADVSAYTNGLYGQLSGATADIDTLAEFNTALGGSILSGADATIITGTEGVSGNCAEWDANGDLIDAGDPCGTGGGGFFSFGELTNVATSSDASGDIYYLNASGDIVNLAKGSDGQVLKLASGLPAWGSDNVGGGGAGLATSTPIVDTYVIYGTSAADVGAEAAFTYDDATNRLTVQNASTTAVSALSAAFGATATTSISAAGTITIGGNIVFAGDTIDELVGAGLSLSSGDLVVNDVTVDMLASSDFGEFSCNGTTCVIDANTIALTTDTTGNYVATLADDGQSTVTVTNGSAEGGAATLRVIDVVCTGCLGTTEIAGLDIGDDTNLAAGRSLTLSGDSVEADAELYTDTKCIWFENPANTDDFKSIWANKTANDITITELWGESDQTVAFDLQIDDGSPADVNGTDITPAAGEAEDTSLSGDTTLAAGEELDLAITSVTNSPTWVSICWTYTWND